MRNARAVLSLALLAVVTTACGAGTVTGTATPPVASPTGPASTPTAPDEVPEILAFEAPLLDGGVFRGADYAGKDVAFWFWAPW